MGGLLDPQVPRAYMKARHRHKRKFAEAGGILL
jgi:hypothetical protein